MNRERAKEILSAFRDGIDSPDSPEFVEAFRLLEHDDELAEWYFSDKEFDDEFAAKLRCCEPPEGLKDRIFDALDEKIVSDKLDEISGCSSKKICFRIPRLCFLHWLGIGTVIAMLALFYFSASSNDQPSDPQQFVYRLQNHFIRLNPGSLEFYSTDLNKIKQHVVSNIHVDFDPNLEQLVLRESKGLGCLTGDMNKIPFGLITFNRAGKLYHLYVFRQEDFPALNLPSEPILTQTESYTYALWKNQSNVYSLVTNQPKTIVQKKFFSKNP